MSKYWFMGEAKPEPSDYLPVVGWKATYKWCKTLEDFELADLLGMKIVVKENVDGWQLRKVEPSRPDR